VSEVATVSTDFTLNVMAYSKIASTASATIDLLTALSILYMYHQLGLKKRKLAKIDSHYSIDGLLN